MSDPVQIHGGQVVLTRDPSTADVEIPDGWVCVHHHRMTPPTVGCRVVDFREFEHDPRSFMRDCEGVLFVGLTRAMTPSTRTREVWEVLFNGTDLPRASLDTALFLSEPWRAWFQFGFVGASYGPYTYSYLAESHWRASREGIRDDDPFALDELLAHGEGVVTSLDNQFFDRFDVEIVEVEPLFHAAYQREKTAAFDEERTEAALVRRLAKVASSACPSRKVPAPHRLWSRHEHSIVATDLAVDRYLVEWLAGLVATTNTIYEHFHR